MLEQHVLTSGKNSTVPDAADVLRETERILASPAFRSSRRSQEILGYLVRHALEGDTDGLKERVIGQEIFGRPLDYDTGQDSIVRGKVNEVRKRLAQYFDEAGSTAAIRIEIPIGSYVPEFHPILRPPAPPSARRKASFRLRLAIAGALVVLAAAGVIAVARYGKPSRFDAFWNPLLESSHAVALCVAHPQVYLVHGSQQEELLHAFRPEAKVTADAKLPLDWRLDAVIVPDEHNFVGIGDAYAIGHLSGLFRSRKRPLRFLRGNEISFSELRRSPSVLIGGFSNQWSLALLRELRYVPRRLPSGNLAIYDQRDGKDAAVLAPFRGQLPHTYVDYAVISRLVRSRTGDALVGVVGVSHYGTMAAAEMVADEKAMENVLAGVPGWSERKNLQILVRVEVMMRTLEKTEVIASHVW